MEYVGLPLSERAAMFKKTLAYYNSASADLTEFYEGVPEFLEYLDMLGVTMGICIKQTIFVDHGYFAKIPNYKIF